MINLGAQSRLRVIPVAPAGTPVNLVGDQQIFFRTINKRANYQLLIRYDQRVTSKNHTPNVSSVAV